MLLSDAQRHYFVKEQIIGPAIFNFVLALGLTWLTFRHHAEVPVYGDPSASADLVATLFLLPLLTCLIATRIARRHAETGKVEPPTFEPDDLRVLRFVPGPLLLRALALGALATLLFAPPTLLLLRLIGASSLPVLAFVIGKGLFAAALAAVVSPMIAIAAFSKMGSPVPVPALS